MIRITNYFGPHHLFFLEAQFLSNKSVTHRLTHPVCHSQTMERLGLWTMFSLFLDRFGRSLRFCHLEYYKEAIG